MGDILASKKFRAAIIAAITAFIASYAGLPVEQVAIVVSPFLAFIGGQALADFGKVDY